MLSRNEIEAGLPQFTGTTQYYRSHPGLLLTDGAKWLAESRVLFDIIWMCPPETQRGGVRLPAPNR